MSILLLNEAAEPSTPASGKGLMWDSSTDSVPIWKDDGGVKHYMVERGWRERNVLINGGFAFAQRQAPGGLTTYSNITGRSYGADRWGMTNENASMQYQRVDSSGATETGLSARYYGKFKKITAAGKMEISQAVEANNCLHLRGRRVRVQAKMKFSVAASMTVRLGLLYLTSAGTLDTIPATFVSAHGAVGTDPTWGTNLTALAPVTGENGTISGLGLTCVLTSSWVRYSATFDVPSSAKNLIPVIWTNGQPAANDELNIAEAGLYDGEEFREWMPPNYDDELLQCQRYYWKSFLTDTNPAQNAGAGTGELTWGANQAAAAANRSPAFRLPTPMFNVGAATVTTYNPSAANAQVRDNTALADTTATAVAANPATGPKGVQVTCTGAAGTAIANQLSVHVSIAAEM